MLFLELKSASSATGLAGNCNANSRVSNTLHIADSGTKETRVSPRHVRLSRIAANSITIIPQPSGRVYAGRSAICIILGDCLARALGSRILKIQPEEFIISLVEALPAGIGRG